MLAWFFKLKDWQQHIVAALGIQAAYAAGFAIAGHWLLGLFVGAIAATHQFFGRENRDAENADPSLYDSLRGLWPPNWRADMRSDFYRPAMAVWGAVACGVLIEVFL